MTSSSIFSAVPLEIFGPPKKALGSSWPSDSGPTFSLIPYSDTIARAICVAFSRSFCAPVRDLTEHELLGDAAAHRERQHVLQLGLGGEVAVLERAGHRESERRGAARDDRDAVDRVQVLAVVRDEGVAHLVGRDPRLLLLAHDARLALQAHRGAVDGLLELVLVHGVLLAACRQQGGLVHDVLQVGAGEARRAGRDGVEVDRG